MGERFTEERYTVSQAKSSLSALGVNISRQGAEREIERSRDREKEREREKNIYFER